MNITSSAFENKGSVPARYTCDGGGVNPPLDIKSVPTAAQSLALIVDDPDAPRGDWVHWLLWNLDPTTTILAENSVPVAAVQGTTDFGTIGWGAPCPPSGSHRYFFKVYALDTRLDLPATARKIDLERAMQGHILEEAQLMGRYQRS